MDIKCQGKELYSSKLIMVILKLYYSKKKLEII